MKDFFEKFKKTLINIRDFLRETRKELNNVSWPNRREVTGTTIVVIASVFFFGFFFFVVDGLVQYGTNYLYHALSVRL